MAGENTRLQSFECNESGRDYVVGDIHGCFDLLTALLGHIGFDRQSDRLFCVGDLFDRGPQNEQVCEWLEQPWFYAIQGNHEAMLLDALVFTSNGLEEGPDAQLWRMNGGGWFFELTQAQQQAIHAVVSELGLGIEVALPGGGRAALVHADVLDDSWPVTRAFLAGSEVSRDAREAMMRLVWSRRRAENVARAFEHHAVDEESHSVAGVDVIYFGHTPMREPLSLANTRWLDTGAVYGGSLSVAELSVEGQVWSMTAHSDVPATGWRRPD